MNRPEAAPADNVRRWAERVFRSRVATYAASAEVVKSAERILPHMEAYICSKCVIEGEHKPVTEEEISNRVFAPWTDDQVGLLREYQSAVSFLPFTWPVRACFDG